MMEIATAADVALGKPLPVRLSRIERCPEQPRTFFLKSSLEELADSIQEDGQEQPVKLTTKLGHPGHFILIDGERRFRSFHIIWERTGREPTVNAFVEVVKDLKEHFRKSTIANLHREDLCSLDTAAALARLRADGETREGLARIIGKSVVYVDNYLRLHTLPEAVKALMDPNLPKESQLTVTQAIDIARGIPEHDVTLRVSVANEAIERNLGVLETRSLVEYRSGSDGYRAGGRFRKPSDDYKNLRSFLGRTKIASQRLVNTLNIDNLYLHRDSEAEDRKLDLGTIDEIIEAFQKMRAEVVENN